MGRAAEAETRPYPLQLISTHSKRRIHSNMHTIAWLRDLEPHTVWINPVDAADAQYLLTETACRFLTIAALC